MSYLKDEKAEGAEVRKIILFCPKLGKEVQATDIYIWEERDRCGDHQAFHLDILCPCGEWHDFT